MMRQFRDRSSLIRAAFWLCLLPALSSPLTTYAASFDCNKAVSKIEKLICTDTELSKLDDLLAATYKDARRSGIPENEVQRQRAWVAQRDGCADAACVAVLYKDRVAELQNLLEQTPPEYFVTCDPTNQKLTIEEVRFSEGGRSVAGASQHRISPLALTKEGGTPNRPIIVPSSERKFQCRLGNTEYRVVIGAFIHNADPQGYCGADPPSISATVLRKGAEILSAQRFADCQTGSWALRRVQFDERAQVVQIAMTPNINISPAPVEKRFTFTSLPKALDDTIVQVK